MNQPKNQSAHHSILSRIFASCWLLLAMLATGDLLAGTITVTNLDDSGAGSLREAITTADGDAGADTIVFDAALNGTITLVSNLPTITDTAGLTIDGNSRITVSGNNSVQPFFVDDDASLNLENLTVSNGLTDFGGGIRNDGTLNLINSTISGNSANDKVGGGILNNSGTLTLINSTLSSNSAVGEGGGIFNTSGGTVSLTNSTVSGNSAGTTGGGIFNDGTVTITNSLIANSSSGGDCFNSGTGTINDDGHNLVEDGSCITPGDNGNLEGDPMLGALADNGGSTLTHALLTGSPAIDAGGNDAASGLDYDQRGFPFERIANGTVDIGAFEVQEDFTVGGTVSGLEGSGLVLQNNGGDDLTIAADGAFIFAAAFENGSSYEVTILTQPASPNQICSVTDGSGTLTGADVDDVIVECPGDLVFRDRFAVEQ